MKLDKHFYKCVLVYAGYPQYLLTFCIQTIHHRLNNVQFGLDREIDKVGVNQDVVWWSKLSIVLEEQA